MNWKKNLIFKIPDSPSEGVFNDENIGKKLLIITDSENFGQDEDISLKRLISSIGFDYDVDVHHLLLSIGQPYAVAKLAVQYEDVLIFGLKAEMLGFNIDIHQNECMYFEKCRLLISDSFKMMNADKSKKTTLWLVLKEMYSIV